jgi:hypothetical protein
MGLLGAQIANSSRPSARRLPEAAALGYLTIGYWLSAIRDARRTARAIRAGE